MPQLRGHDYTKVARLIGITNETTAHSIARQAYSAFRTRIYDKYVPIYRDANELEDPKERRQAQVGALNRMSKDINKFFGDFQTKTLNPLTQATVAATRLEHQFIDAPSDIREARQRLKRKRERSSVTQRRGARRQLQLGRGDRTDPRDQSYRHKGSRSHVKDKLTAGLAREMKKVGVTMTRAQFEARTKRWVNTVAQTEAQGAIADGKLQAIRETYDKYRYVAVLDDATTERCSYLDGQEFKVDEGTLPPQHFNCRSEIQPVTMDKEMNKAMERDAKVKFKTWLKRQPEGTQRAVVGDKMFKAYKEGKYTPPPRWRETHKYYVDPKTKMPVINTKENLNRLEERLEVIDVEFDPSLIT